MKTNNFNVEELSISEMKLIEGGYGWHPYHNAAAEQVGKAFWAGISSFIDGFAEGYNNATRKGGSL
ncbi:hypothetical protein [Runella zeae]|uniref:hypothetical protein n=1 Tax=Runella zeae TaxID=94255 RepID=UPI00048D2A4D|nr:hypothetical protein [Runella zeae]